MVGSRLAAAGAALMLGLLLALLGCDAQRIAQLEEGVSTEADVRKQFGEPATVVEHADGTRTLEYPRQPEGSTNYRIVIGADGKMTSLRQLLTPANFAKVQPGMGKDAVRQMLGRPAQVQRYALTPDEEHWDWRYVQGQQKKVFTATFGQDGALLRSASADDPREALAGGGSGK